MDTCSVLREFIKRKKLPKEECANIMKYLLHRKFCRVSNGRLVVVQSRMQTLRIHRREVINQKRIENQSLETLKSRKEQKKQAKALAAKVIFNEMIVVVLKVVFMKIDAFFSFDLFQNWTHDLMRAQWYDFNKYRDNEEGELEGNTEPNKRSAFRLVEKMLKSGLIMQKKIGQKTFVQITHKGAVYCGLLEEDFGIGRLSKDEKFSRKKFILSDIGIPINACGLRSLKKEVRRAQASV
ncbi:TPA: hypothetical protein DCR85_00260 [Candidatus Moranbacteria bacterium]|nr:hypothetical protein [Candidatus Moranbacteria bacterium]HBI50324.1 hypothetical protein [Candidatus Moranbacteria bacterium]